MDGQNVINVAPGHFVTTNGLSYPSTVAYSSPLHSVPAGDYGFFNNTPDERYPRFDMEALPGDVEMLFASDYSDSGSEHVLGFTHRRPAWGGEVVA